MKVPRRLIPARAGGGDGPERSRPSWLAGRGRWWLILLVAPVLFFALTARVDAGEACAVTRFGKVVDEAGPGIHLRLPLVDRYRCFRTAATFYEVLEEEFNSEADFADGGLDGVTKDGQPVTMTFNLRYHVPEANVGEVYATIGKTMNDVNARVVKFHSRAVIRQLTQQYTAAQLYSGDLAGIGTAMGQTLAPRFIESGIVLDYFELKRPRFQPAYEQAIESKQIALENVTVRQYEAQAAVEEANREKNLAQGAADAERIRAEGEAQAIALRGKAVRENPEIISLNYIEALKTINWAILDGESVTPFLTLTPPTGDAGTVLPTPEAAASDPDQP